MDHAPAPARQGFVRSWLPPLLGLAVFLVGIVGLGVVAGDWYWRNAEMNRVVTSIEASEQAMTDAQDQIGVALSDFRKSDGGPEAKAELDAAIRSAAADGYQAVHDAGDKVASVRVALWHPRIAAARDAYLAHNGEWQKFLGGVSQNAAMLDSTDNNINPTFMAAEEAIRAALPESPLFQLRDRVDMIFAPVPESGSDSGGMLPA